MPRRPGGDEVLDELVERLHALVLAAGVDGRIGFGGGAGGLGVL
jgi:hypothetical protein